MYRDPRSLREGFRKNLYPLVGGGPGPLLLALVVFGLVALAPWALAPAGEGALLPLLLLLGIRACGLALFRQSALSVLLHPPGALAVALLAVQSFLGTRRGTLRWKGRPIGAPCEYV